MYVCMYKEDLALNKPQELICHKTEVTNQSIWRHSALFSLFNGISTSVDYLMPKNNSIGTI